MLQFKGNYILIDSVSLNQLSKMRISSANNRTPSMDISLLGGIPLTEGRSARPVHRKEKRPHHACILAPSSNEGPYAPAHVCARTA